MANELHDIENLFHAALDDNEELPSAKVWAAVDNRLDKDRVIAAERKYKRLKRVSLLLLLLLLALSIYELVLVPRGRDHVPGTKGNQAQETVPAQRANGYRQGSKTVVQQADQSAHGPISRDSTAARTPASAAGVNGDGRAQTNPIIKTMPSGQTAVLGTGSHAPGPSKAERINNKLQTERKEERSLPGQDPSGWWLQMPTVKRALAPLPLTAKGAEHLPLPQPSNIVGPTGIPLTMVKKRRTGFSLSAFYSRDVAWYRLKETGTASGPDNANSIRNTEEYDFSFTAGLLVDYPIKERWTLLSGLRYSYTDIIVGPKTLYAQPDNTGTIKYRVNVSAGYSYIVPSFQPTPAVGDSLKVTAIAHKLQYLGVPVLLGKNLANGKLSLQAMGGLGVNFLLNAKVETEIQHGSNNEIDIRTKLQGLKPVYLDGQAGVGIRYAVHKKVSLQLVPTARFALTSINKGGVVKTYPNSLGVGMGVNIRF